MIKSMTGYGRAQQVISGRDITVEIKSVNHRYFEFSARLPRIYGFLEERLKSFLQSEIHRGKTEVNVIINNVEVSTTAVQINQELAQAYVEALRGLGQKLALADDLSLSAIGRFSDIFIVQKKPEDEDEIWSSVSVVATQALEKFLTMREREGEQLKADLLSRLLDIEGRVDIIREENPRTVAAYRERLTAKIQEVLQDKTVDETRIITEAAIFADRIAIDEEMVRLGSHLQQFRDILDQDGAVGRKLDFLVQEINRESNTIGSKAQDAIITQTVVDLKSDIEKIREQIQNIE